MVFETARNSSWETWVADFASMTPEKPGASFGAGFAAFTGGDLTGRGSLESAGSAGIDGRVAQAVEVAVGEPREALEARFAEDPPGALAELANGRSGERAAQRIDLGEQQHILAVLRAREIEATWHRWCLSHPFSARPSLWCSQAAKVPGNERVRARAFRGFESEWIAAFGDGADRVQTLESLGLEGRDH